MLYRVAILTATAFGLAGQITLAAESEPVSPEILVHYDESNPAPDYVVFRSYLRQLDAQADQDGAHFVQDSMQIEHDERGDLYARQLYFLLSDRHALLEDEIRETEKRVLCEKGQRKRTTDEVYAAMDGLFAARDRIAEKHYLDTITTVDNASAQLIDSVIQGNKKSFASTRYSHQSLYGDSDAKVRKQIKGICRKLTKRG